MINTVCQFGEWLEFYAQALELNVWTSALVEKVGKDEKGQWNVTVRRGGPNGTVRILHPTHVIIATGLSGNPYVPRFEGEVCQTVPLGRGLRIYVLSVNAGKLQGRGYPYGQVYKRKEQRREESSCHRFRNFGPRRCCRSR